MLVRHNDTNFPAGDSVSPLLTGPVMDEVSKLYPLLSRAADSASTDLYHAITTAISLSEAPLLPPRDRMSDSSHWPLSVAKCHIFQVLVTNVQARRNKKYKQKLSKENEKSSSLHIFRRLRKNLLKVIINFVMSACLSVCPQGKTRLPLDGF